MNKPLKSLESDVRDVLLREWDPIGIKDVQEAQDEYDRYATAICGMLRSNQTLSEIYDHLRWIEVQHIGLDGDEEHTKRIAMRLIALLG